MSGPRVTSGKDSKQDFATPENFLREAVEKRFGPVAFDLAAHAGNAKHERYFAPTHFDERITKHTDLADVVDSLSRRGASAVEAQGMILARWPTGNEEAVVRVPNRDQRAFGFNTFSWNWSKLLIGGLGWLNCEFNDSGSYAEKCCEEMARGANVTLLTPDVVTNWSRDFVFGRADVYRLVERLCFDGKNPYPKGCMLSHYHPQATGKVCLWSWKNDEIIYEWRL